MIRSRKTGLGCADKWKPCCSSRRNLPRNFRERKRGDGVMDFHDLEQFALKSALGFFHRQTHRRGRNLAREIEFIFVDEYQDINAAQDKIIAALARDGKAANRFLVGDVKQSIYRFRLADPKIFRDYAQGWRGAKWQGHSAHVKIFAAANRCWISSIRFFGRSCVRKSAAWLTTMRPN